MTLDDMEEEVNAVDLDWWFEGSNIWWLEIPIRIRWLAASLAVQTFTVICLYVVSAPEGDSGRESGLLCGFKAWRSCNALN